VTLQAIHRFVAVSRKFGLTVALRVAYSKVRGALLPSLRLPEASWTAQNRQLSVLLEATDHGLDSLHRLGDMIVTQNNLDWELCICERPAATSEMIAGLKRLRGAHPCIRIVTANNHVTDDIAARWTVEQATGQFLALIATNYVPDPRSICRLLLRLQQNSEITAVAIIDWDRADRARSIAWEHCLMLVQRKSSYLFRGDWQLSVTRAAKALSDRRVPIEIIAKND
jgi:hypothetical protein